MKFSEAWLREWVALPWNTQQLVDHLTMAGLEVDSVTSIANDTIIDLDLTPNRGDCLSIMGVAREVAALAAVTPKPVPVYQNKNTIPDKHTVKVTAGTDCPRYLGRIIKGISNRGNSPDWLQARLEQAGIRTISPVVDIGNYVMLELGQPLHAFDLNKIQGNVTVRPAKAGEQLTLLNDQTVTLQANTLVIADDKNILALAGVMGGLDSSVTTDTNTIFLESAFFTANAIAGRARRYGLSTDASHRFERGVDPNITLQAMERATQLLLEIVGGQAGPVIEVATAEHLPKPVNLKLESAQIKRILGLEINAANVTDILSRLGLKVTAQSEGWLIEVPSFRADITLEVDLIEEIARVYGYDKVPTHAPQAQLTFKPRSEKQVSLQTLNRVLLDRGYQEVITYSFVEPQLQQRLFPQMQGLALTNPISADMSVMRVSLWPGLLKTVSYNQYRQQGRLRFFESGLCFLPGDTLQQEARIGGVITGELYPEQWGEAKRKLDFFDAKGDVEALLQITGCLSAFRFVAAEHPALHPKQSAQIIYNDVCVGYVGALHPSISQQLDLKGPVFLFELSLQHLLLSTVPAFQGISRFPSIRRDLAIVVADSVTAQTIHDTVVKAAGELLSHANIFDVYQGEGIAPGKKSIAIGLVLRHPSRTLVDSEVNTVVDEVVSTLAVKFNATMRE